MYALLIREMAGLLLEHRRKSEDILAHGIGVDHLMEAVLVEIACADIDSRSIQIRRDHRDVAERSIVFLKAEAADELRKVGVITAVEHSIIRAAPIQLNDIVDLRPQLALGKFPRAHAADFFLFTKKNVATELNTRSKGAQEMGRQVAQKAIRRCDMDHYKDIEEIPMIFGPRELSKILGISKNKTYDVVNRYDFPKIRVGRRIIISKKHFLEWMDANFGKERNNT